MLAALYEMSLNLIVLVRHDCGAYDFKSSSLKLAYNSRSGKVFPLALERRVADGEYGGSVHS